MTKQPLDEREFELINIVGAGLATNQRDLSRHLDLSLGATNMLLRRLVTKGYIRIRQLNERKVKYFLTPKGLTEKMRKSVKYTLKTIQFIHLIKENIKRIIWDLYQEGERDFFVLGKSDFAFLIDMACKELDLQGHRLEHIDEVPKGKWKGVLLICKENVSLPQDGGRYVDLIYELAKDEKLILSSTITRG